MALTYVINERTLTDDTLTVAEDGEAFKGGYQAILTYYTYANAWGDRGHVRRFRTVEAAEAFIAKRYGATFEELVYGHEEEG